MAYNLGWENSHRENPNMPFIHPFKHIVQRTFKSNAQVLGPKLGVGYKAPSKTLFSCSHGTFSLEGKGDGGQNSKDTGRVTGNTCF